jgi:hypothetical protein
MHPGLDRHDQANLLIALVRAKADREVLELLPPILAEEGLAPDTRAWLTLWAADGRRPAGDPPAYFMAPALGYIPNLDG